jgi:hypothetical protein
MKFVIMEVLTATLGRIINEYWEIEGFASRHEFLDYWIKIHPRKKFVPGQVVHMHRFVDADPERTDRRTVRIPFKPEMAELVRAGKKTATTRTRRMGGPGDVFEV